MEPLGPGKLYIHSDIISYILEFLPFKKLIEIRRTCKLFNRITESGLFWESKAKRDFKVVFYYYKDLTSRYVETKYFQLETKSYEKIKEEKLRHIDDLTRDTYTKASDLKRLGKLLDKYHEEIGNIDRKVITLCKFIEEIENPKTRYNLGLLAKTSAKILGPEDYFNILFNIGSYTLRDFKVLFKAYFEKDGLIRSFNLFLLTTNNIDYICIYVYRGATGLKISHSFIDSRNKKLPEIMYYVANRYHLTKRMIKELYDIPFDFEIEEKPTNYNKLIEF